MYWLRSDTWKSLSLLLVILQMSSPATDCSRHGGTFQVATPGPQWPAPTLAAAPAQSRGLSGVIHDGMPPLCHFWWRIPLPGFCPCRRIWSRNKVLLLPQPDQFSGSWVTQKWMWKLHLSHSETSASLQMSVTQDFELMCVHTQSCLTFATPTDCSLQSPLSIGFSRRQEYWSCHFLFHLN